MHTACKEEVFTDRFINFSSESLTIISDSDVTCAVRSLTNFHRVRAEGQEQLKRIRLSLIEELKVSVAFADFQNRRNWI